MIEAMLRFHLGLFQMAANVSGSGTICLAGKNGSGKTSLLKVIGGFLQADEGYVRVGGADVTKLPVEQRGIVMVTPRTFFPHLDVDSHIAWGARLRRVKADEGRVSRLKSALGIDFGGHVGKLSLGMRERVALATALLATPKLIMVDEAFSNLHDREDFIVAYCKLAGDEGIDLIFTAQDESDGKYANQLYVIENGSTALK